MKMNSDSIIVEKWNHYIKAFEYADYTTILDRFILPATFSFANQPSITLNTKEDLVNIYTSVRETNIQPGYKYSLTDQIRVIWIDPDTCYADVIFSRYNDRYEKLMTSRGWYFFKKEKEDWKLFEVRSLPFE
jgi:hypothetical protein